MSARVTESDLFANIHYNDERNLYLDANYLIVFTENNNISEIHSSMLLNQIPDHSKGSLNKLSEDKINLLLEFLTKREIYTKKNYGLIQSCPTCNSLTHIGCPECGSKKYQPERKIIHKKCGCLDYLEKFIDKSGLRCPGCGDKIRYTEDGGINGDYRFCDIKYTCIDCRSQVSNLNTNEKVMCSKCNKMFRKNRTKIYDLSIFSKSNNSSTFSILRSLQQEERTSTHRVRLRDPSTFTLLSNINK